MPSSKQISENFRRSFDFCVKSPYTTGLTHSNFFIIKLSNRGMVDVLTKHLRKFAMTTGAQIGIDPGVALTVLDQAMNIQVTYGAVMLSFLGKPFFSLPLSDGPYHFV